MEEVKEPAVHLLHVLLPPFEAKVPLAHFSHVTAAVAEE